MNPRTFILPACTALAVAACSDGGGSIASSMVADSGGLSVSTALALDHASASAGDTVTGTVTYTNSSGSPYVVQAGVIAARPPGGSHAGGPYDDFAPYAAATTLQPGQSFTITATRAFAAGDPRGAWDLYPTYEDGDGTWHDGADVTLNVGEPAVTTFTITSALALTQSADPSSGAITVNGTVTYTNGTASPVVVDAGVIAARPPGGTHSGGPYDDFQPYAAPVTVPAGGTFTVQASRIFAASDPAGAWDIYPTYQDGSGAWHDGPDQSFTPGMVGTSSDAGAGGSDAGGGGGGSGGSGALVPSPLAGNVSTGAWQSGTINGMSYQYLMPSGYSTTYQYPLVLYLHQLDNASQIPSQIDPWFNTTDYRTNYPSIVIAPQCNMDADPSGNTINWGGVSMDDQSCQDNAIALVDQFMKEDSVYAPKVYVTGNSMGGIGSWDAIIKYNSKSPTVRPLFAATLILAGATYDWGYPTPNESVVTALKNVPIWAIHGGQDTQVPLDWDRNLFAAEQSSGGLMKLLIDDNLAHDVWDTYYVSPTSDTYWSWLFAQTF